MIRVLGSTQTGHKLMVFIEHVTKVPRQFASVIYTVGYLNATTTRPATKTQEIINTAFKHTLLVQIDEGGH